MTAPPPRQPGRRRVLASPNHGERRGLPGRTRHPALHRHADRRGGARVAVRSGLRSVVALFRLGETGRRSTRRRGPARLARRASASGGANATSIPRRSGSKSQPRPRRRAAAVFPRRRSTPHRAFRDIAARPACGPSECSPIPTSRRPANAIPASDFRGSAGARRRRPMGRAGAIVGGPRFAPAGGAASPGAAGDARALRLRGRADGVYDAPTHSVVAAFQRHFRPALVDGEADMSTIETLRALINSLHNKDARLS